MFVSGKAFQPKEMFVGKAKSLPKWSNFGFSPLGQALGLTCTQKTKIEKLASDKHSSLLRTFVNYDRKKFHNIGPVQKTFF